MTPAGPAGPDPYVGRTIAGDIVLERLIGTGASGRVYRGAQRGLGRDVAVKILRRELSGNASVVERFEREARIAGLLQHPHVVDVYLAGQLDDGALFIVMEHLDGVSLGAALDAAGGSFPVRRALAITLAMCEALDLAHARGIVHRDVKPDNVMLVRRGGIADWVKVLDFGVAKGRVGSAEGAAVETAAGLVFGTAPHISPEAACGAEVVPASDVYSLATVLYRMLAGRAPFDANDAVTLLVKHVHEAPPDLRSFAPARNVPGALARVIMDNLAKDPSARAKDAGAFGAALSRAARADGIAAAGTAETAEAEREREEARDSASGLYASVPGVPRPIARDRRLWARLGLAAILLTTTVLAGEAVRERPDAAHAAVVAEARAALADGRYVSPPSSSGSARAALQDIVAAGLTRWPGDPTLAKLRADGALALVTESMAARSGGDVEGAAGAAEKALLLDPGDEVATLLADQDEAELRALASGADDGPPRIALEAPESARVGDTIDVRGRLWAARRAAAPRARVEGARITLREGGPPGERGADAAPVSMTEAARGAFSARVTLRAAGRACVVFEATVDGTKLRAARAVDVSP